MPGRAIVIAVVAAVLVTGCGSGGSLTYKAHAKGSSLGLCTACSPGTGGARLTGRIKARAVATTVPTRLGLQMLVVFCAPSADGTSDHHVAVGHLPAPQAEGHGWSFSADFLTSLPQAHDYVCGLRIRRPKGVSSISYARLRASYVHGALIALHLSRR